jgi:hypothetical protein
LILRKTRRDLGDISEDPQGCRFRYDLHYRLGFPARNEFPSIRWPPVVRFGYTPALNALYCATAVDFDKPRARMSSGRSCPGMNAVLARGERKRLAWVRSRPAFSACIRSQQSEEQRHVLFQGTWMIAFLLRFTAANMREARNEVSALQGNFPLRKVIGPLPLASCLEC